MNSSPGRNDPCPCGSGEKYKKCCLHRVEKQQRIRKQEGYQPHQDHWSRSEVEAMDTEEILDRLYFFGIYVSEKGFLKEVSEYYSAQIISENWFDRFDVRVEGFDEDFPFLATWVLWERLAPEKMYDEKLDALMQEGYRLNHDQLHQGCDIWVKVWNLIEERIPEEITDIHEANKVFPYSQYLENWIQDMEMNLNNAAGNRINGRKEYYYKLKDFCLEFIERFPDSGESIIFSMKRTLAEVYFEIGDKEVAEKRFQALIREYPDNVFAYISWGDMYYQFGRNDDPEDIKKAMELYKRAIGKDFEDEEVALERLEDLKHQHNL